MYQSLAHFNEACGPFIICAHSCVVAQKLALMHGVAPSWQKLPVVRGVCSVASSWQKLPLVHGVCSVASSWQKLPIVHGVCSSASHNRTNSAGFLWHRSAGHGGLCCSSLIGWKRGVKKLYHYRNAPWKRLNKHILFVWQLTPGISMLLLF